MSPALRIACRHDVVVRALKVAAVVGTILVAINHGHAIVAGAMDTQRIIQALLTYCVPYGVSTYSSVRAIVEFSQPER